jgi:hypothetical protein
MACRTTSSVEQDPRVAYMFSRDRLFRSHIEGTSRGGWAVRYRSRARLWQLNLAGWHFAPGMGAEILQESHRRLDARRCESAEPVGAAAVKHGETNKDSRDRFGWRFRSLHKAVFPAHEPAWSVVVSYPEPDMSQILR